MSEVTMMQAISEHMTEVTGQPHVVTEYVVITDCLDSDGEEQLLWISSNPKWANDYKMVGYVFEQIKHRMKNAWDDYLDHEDG